MQERKDVILDTGLGLPLACDEAGKTARDLTPFMLATDERRHRTVWDTKDDAMGKDSGQVRSFRTECLIWVVYLLFLAGLAKIFDFL